MQTNFKDECTCVVAFTTATDRRKLIDIPPVYTTHVVNSQHTERACFPYFLSAYIRLCHCFHSFFCLGSLYIYIYVHPSYLKCLLHLHENWRNLNIDARFFLILYAIKYIRIKKTNIKFK